MSLSLSKNALAIKSSSTLEITAKAKAMKAKGIDVVGFGAGEPDFDTSDNIKKAAIAAIHEGFTKYTPVSGTKELKEAICKKLKEFNHLDYTPEQIVVSNGGKHSLSNIFEAILNPDDEVIIPSPYWLTYPEIVKLAGGVPIFIEGTKENDYKVTATQIRQAVTDKTKGFILNTPSNPTGMVYTEEELREIAKVAVEKDFYVISDEIYEQLIYDGKKHISIASFGEDIYHRTITCSGVSKSYSMTGWRIGYTASHKELAKVMGNIQSHQTSNPNSIAQKATLEALSGEQGAIEMMREEFDNRRKYMYHRLSQMPFLDCLEPQGAFYFFVDCSEALECFYQGEQICTIGRLVQILLEDYQVAAVVCDDFGFADHIRLSYAIALEDIEKGLDRIENFAKELRLREN